MDSSSCSMANLPDTVLMEVLCRVPFKTLMASKSVCKSWLNMIRDPQFRHVHQSRAPTEVFFQPYHDNKDNTMKLHLGNFNIPVRKDRVADSDMVVADVCAIEKKCSWKRIDPCSSHAWFRDYHRPRDLHAVFFQGTLHWVVRNSCIALHTFDFEDDRFGRVALPRSIGGHLHPSHEDNLGVLGGCLFIAEHKLDYNTSVIVWLMKEYGVEDSWTKLFCLGSTISVDKWIQMEFNHYLPIIYMDNGEMLMKCAINCRSTVVVYSPVKSARVVVSCPATFRAIAYSPSIVMLKDSMLGYHVQAIPRCHTIGLKWGEMSKALVLAGTKRLGSDHIV